ncbi:hypothetical protein EON80_23130 [bacterium]|nr:MAG: hypothetical protein EON80_23130 [bacterium]
MIRPTSLKLSHRFILAGAIVLMPLLAARSYSAPTEPVPAPAETQKAPEGPTTHIELEGVHNAFKWTDKIISGSCPEGDAGFKALADLGVKTIVSVDGALPILESAKKYGMRYVHIPVEYSGITKTDAIRIIRAVRDLPGPVFIHCHHGKHRSPTATALVAIAIAKYTNEEALAGLKQAGTGVNYVGLWKQVREFQAPTQAEIDAADKSFPEQAKVEGLSGHMVTVDQRFDGMKAVQAAKWAVPADHPDIDPAHESLLLHEALLESARTKEAQEFPADFMEKMDQAIMASAALEEALRGKNAEKAQVAFVAVQNSCGNCHKLYRDVERD